jgi:hypothetical protein
MHAISAELYLLQSSLGSADRYPSIQAKPESEGYMGGDLSRYNLLPR